MKMAKSRNILLASCIAIVCFILKVDGVVEIVGPKGEQGPPGSPGRPGLAGLTGRQGDDGRDGRPGVDGRPGLRGDVGYPGRPGMVSPGRPSMPGEKGNIGPPGEQGWRGLPGMDGAPGYNGPKGSTGVSGMPGEDCECTSESPDGPVGFSVYADSVPAPANEVAEVAITDILSNAGAGFSQGSAEFAVPRNGVYYFAVTAISQGNGAVPINVLHNGQEVFTTAREEESAIGVFPLGTNKAVLSLSQGDKIKLQVRAKREGAIGALFNEFYSPTDVTFTGYMLQ